jgi:hypothetical protein
MRATSFRHGTEYSSAKISRYPYLESRISLSYLAGACARSMQYEELIPESKDLCLEHGSLPESVPNRVERREDDREPQDIAAVVQIQ